MPFVRIWVHLIWSTKNREKIITQHIKEQLLAHIIENAKMKDIWLSSINCVADHIHLLISLGAEQNISKIAMLIKGEASHWINHNSLCKIKFEWQDEYIAISVSESSLERVRSYIQKQEEHHRLKTFAEEYDEVMKKYGSNYLSN